MKEKIAKLLKHMFTYIMAALMIVALLVAFCYIAAFIVGCPMSETICAFLNNYILPYVYMLAIAACLVGVVNMYFTNNHVFVLDIGKKK